MNAELKRILPRRRGSKRFSSMSLASVPSSIKSSFVITPMVRAPENNKLISGFNRKSPLQILSPQSIMAMGGQLIFSTPNEERRT